MDVPWSIKQDTEQTLGARGLVSCDVAIFDSMSRSYNQRLWEVLLAITPPSALSEIIQTIFSHSGCCNRPGHQFRAIWLQNRIHPSGDTAGWPSPHRQMQTGHASQHAVLSAAAMESRVALTLQGGRPRT